MYLDLFNHSLFKLHCIVWILYGSVVFHIANFNEHSNRNKYFELTNSWGCRPNSKYLLSSFASQDTATCQSNATTCKKYEHT